MEPSEENRVDHIKRGLSWVEIKKSLNVDGCPVCNTTLRAVEKYFEFMLYEYALDVSVHKKMLSSMGMCNTHTILLQEAEARLQSDGLNIAVLHETILQKEIKLLSGIEKNSTNDRKKNFLNFSKVEDFKDYQNEIISKFVVDGKCPGCIHQQGNELFYTHEIIRLYQDKEFRKGFENEKILICRNHFILLLKESPNKDELNYFMNVQRKKITNLHRQLTGFVAKHDYRLKKEMLDNECNSWTKVLEYLGSKKYLTPFS